MEITLGTCHILYMINPLYTVGLIFVRHIGFQKKDFSSETDKFLSTPNNLYYISSLSWIIIVKFKIKVS